ncbi:MAG: GGDEF domain-containing protein [Actinomycetales bacterium]|nr:GGDEF domain-containing protein [Actinomycetales bacterium]
MRSDPPIIAVLSPFVGGPYYGELLNGVCRGVRRTGRRVLVVQTLDAGSFRAEAHTTPDRLLPVAHHHADGFIVPVGAVGDGHLELLRATGKDIVLVGYQADGLPSVRADNAVGVSSAVAHLIEHGHSRIAFVGHRATPDVDERYQGYLRALRAHRIEPDPALVYDTEDDLEDGGEAAADAVIRDGLPPTATVCGTDLNAIGFMRVLRRRGYRLPDDQAVVGFDDIDRAAFQVPSLATVAQHTDAMGVAAAELLDRRLLGDRGEVEQVRVPTSFIPRASCACPAGGASAVGQASPLTPREALTARLAALIPPASGDHGTGARVVPELVDEITRAVLASRDGVPPPSPESLLTAFRSLCGIRRQPGTLRLASEAVQEFADDVAPVGGTPAPALRRVASTVRDLTVLMARAQDELIFQSRRDLGNAVSTHYEVTMDLFHSPDEDPRTLRWMRHTPARGGCLGLWAEGQQPWSRDVLDIVGVYSPDGAVPVPREATTVAGFPPIEVIEMAEDQDDVVLVVPAKVNLSDWGLLTFVGPLQTRIENGRESLYQCTALLTVALDLRSKESQLRRAALYDDLTGLANRTLFMEQLQRTVLRAERHPDYRFAVLFLDLDGFKKINDTLGHTAGDEVLVEVARRITESVRRNDLVGRFGGDEFLVLLDGLVTPESTDEVAARFREAMLHPITAGGHAIRVRVSVGVWTSADGLCSAEEVLRHADNAMYRAKSARDESLVR